MSDTLPPEAVPTRNRVTHHTGEHLGDWVLVSPLGTGGFGEVWQATWARDGSPPNDLPTTVALKIIAPDKRSDHADTEAQVGKDLNHPNLLRTFDFFRAGPLAVIVNELAAGSLDDHLDAQGPLRGAAATTFLREVAAGLQALHCHRPLILHLDLTPKNVLWSGSAWKVADFGLAHVLPADQYSATGMASVRTTPPEARRHIHPDTRVRPAWDVWAFGVLAHIALTGEDPPHGEVGSQIPPGIRPVLAKALNPNPSKRYATGDELADACRAVSARPTNTGPKMAAAATVGVLAIVSLVAFTTRSNGGSPTGPATALATTIATTTTPTLTTLASTTTTVALVDHIAITPSSQTMIVGEEVTLAVTAASSAGTQLPVPVTPIPEWKSSDDRIVGVAQDGRITALSEGTAVVNVSQGTWNSQALIVVQPPPALDTTATTTPTDTTPAATQTGAVTPTTRTTSLASVSQTAAPPTTPPAPASTAPPATTTPTTAAPTTAVSLSPTTTLRPPPTG